MRINECQVEGLIDGRAIVNVDRRARLDEYLDCIQIHLSDSMVQGSVVVFVKRVQVEATRHKLSQTRMQNRLACHALEKLGVHDTKLESYT